MEENTTIITNQKEKDEDKELKDENELNIYSKDLSLCEEENSEISEIEIIEREELLKFYAAIKENDFKFLENFLSIKENLKCILDF